MALYLGKESTEERNCTSGFNRCEGDGIYIPTEECDSCGSMVEELEALKATVAAQSAEITTLKGLIGNKTNTVIAMTDSNNNEVSVTVLAE